jgi:hypothetical protein
VHVFGRRTRDDLLCEFALVRIGVAMVDPPVRGTGEFGVPICRSSQEITRDGFSAGVIFFGSSGK